MHWNPSTKNGFGGMQANAPLLRGLFVGPLVGSEDWAYDGLGVGSETGDDGGPIRVGVGDCGEGLGVGSETGEDGGLWVGVGNCGPVGLEQSGVGDIVGPSPPPSPSVGV